jgi:hypothetical protein
MMKIHQKKLILLMVVLLVALNIWRWWPVSTKQPNKVVSKTGLFSVEDFEVKAIPAESQAPMLRDIFQPKKTVKEITQVKVKPITTQLPPAKSPEELAKGSAEAEFSQIRCVGMSVRNERYQAYIIIAGEPLLVSRGDKVGSRFVVDKISSDGVTLLDPETGVGGLISISGK